MGRLPFSQEKLEQMENPKYVMSKDAAGKFRFILRAVNGEPILNASEGYNSRTDCLTAISSCQANSPFDSRYERKQGITGKYFFVLKAANGQVIGVSESYDTSAGRDNGIEACKRDGPTYRIEDLS